ncbi:hypothetical protein VNI00_018221 [Paramarasmius palmivorus]|uniref:FHA domain-containing protein n=1 Tax=Paramarasmius palmivorus TaxID=297713 RepID=A0AAW0AYT1_9AGAR
MDPSQDASQIGRYGTLSLLSSTDSKLVTSFGIDTPELTFGRSSSCSVRLYYPDIEDVHARIVFGDDNKAFLIVLGTSGLTVDECKIYPSTVPLFNNSQLEIHGKQFRFNYPPKEMRAQFVWDTPEPQTRTRLSMIRSSEVFSPRPSPNPAENLRILQSPLKLPPSSPLRRSPIKRSLFSETQTEEEEIVLVDTANPHVVQEDNDLVILEELPFAPSPQKATPPPPSLPPQTPRRTKPTLHRAVLIRSAQRAVLKRQVEEEEREEEEEVFGVLAEEDEDEAGVAEENVFEVEEQAGEGEQGQGKDTPQSSWLGRIWPFTSRSPSPTKGTRLEELEAEADQEDEAMDVDIEQERIYPSLEGLHEEPVEVKEEDEDDDVPAPQHTDIQIAGTPRRFLSPSSPTKPKTLPFRTPQPHVHLNTNETRMSMGGLPTRLPKQEKEVMRWKVEDIVVSLPSTSSTSASDSTPEPEPTMQTSQSDGMLHKTSKARESLSPRKACLSEEEKQAIRARRKSALLDIGSPFKGGVPGMSASPKPAPGLGLGSPTKPKPGIGVGLGLGAPPPKPIQEDKAGEKEDTRALLDKMKLAMEGMKNRRVSGSFSPSKAKQEGEEGEFSLLRSPMKGAGGGGMVPRRKSVYVVGVVEEETGMEVEESIPVDENENQEVAKMPVRAKMPTSTPTVEEVQESVKPPSRRSKTPTPTADVEESTKRAKTPTPTPAEETEQEVVKPPSRRAKTPVEEADSIKPPSRRAKTPTPATEEGGSVKPLSRRAKTPTPGPVDSVKPPSKRAKTPTPVEETEPIKPTSRRAKTPTPAVEEAAPVKPPSRRAKTPTPAPAVEEVEPVKPPSRRAKTPTPVAEEGESVKPPSRRAKTPTPAAAAQEDEETEPEPEPEPRTRARSKTPTRATPARSRTAEPQEPPSTTTTTKRARSRTADTEPKPTTTRARSRTAEPAPAATPSTRTRSRTADPAPTKTTRARANSDSESDVGTEKAKAKPGARKPKPKVPEVIKEESPPPVTAKGKVGEKENAGKTRTSSRNTKVAVKTEEGAGRSSLSALRGNRTPGGSSLSTRVAQTNGNDPGYHYPINANIQRTRLALVPIPPSSSELHRHSIYSTRRRHKYPSRHSHTLSQQSWAKIVSRYIMEGTVAVQFPQEVLDSIMNNLHPRDDIQAFKQCALTARWLVPAAQRILFREVILTECGYPGMQNPPDRFLSLLEHSPHLARYVTELELRIVPSQWGDNLSQHPLASILPRLQSLKKVYIRAPVERPIVTSLQISTLLGGAAMPEIRSFTLRYTTMAIHEIVALCNWLAVHGGLQDLHFIRVDVSDLFRPPPSTLPQAISGYAPIQLRRFTIDTPWKQIKALFRWATGSTSPLRFNALRELTVSHLTQQSSVYLPRILDVAKDSLSCIEVTGYIAGLASIRFNYRHLRRIAWNSCILTPRDFETMVNEWCIVLKESRELKLESFVISFSWTAYHPDYSWSVLLWNEFEDGLINSGRCAHLVLQNLDEGPTRIGTDTIRKCFPLLHASNACDLVVIERIGDSSVLGKYDNWEYTSRSGDSEWKSLPPGNIFD